MRKTDRLHARPPDLVDEGTFASPPCFMHELEAYYLPQEETDQAQQEPPAAKTRPPPIGKERRDN